MVHTDPIADFLTRVRNGQKALLPHVDVSYSKMKHRLADILQREGFLASVRVLPGKPTNTLQVGLRYRRDGKPMIMELRRVSRPGCRMYSGSQEIPSKRGGITTTILSTSKGLLTDREAKEQNIGGELICQVM